MRIKPEFAVDDLEAAQALVREHPFATIVAPDLRMTRMPCLLEDHVDRLAVRGHVARADPFASALGGPLLLIFGGVHGYISASWYGTDTIPTWNHITLQVRGVADCCDDAMPILRQTVDHFEAAVEQPWSLDRMGDEAREMADQVIAFRLVAQHWHLEMKLSQDKPAEERERLIGALGSPGPYGNDRLAQAMREAESGGRPAVRDGDRLGGDAAAVRRGEPG
jgi:transcriptional regulator